MWFLIEMLSGFSGIGFVIDKQRRQQADDAQKHDAQAFELAGHVPADDGQGHAEDEEGHDQNGPQAHVFFPKFHSRTLAFQTAHGHALGQVLLDADVEDQHRQHDQHQARVHGAIFRGGLRAKRTTLQRLHKLFRNSLRRFLLL